MAWTAPRTWVAEVMTSALLNVHVRDNLNALWPTVGQLCGVNTTEQTTTSTTAVDLVTVTLSPTITVDQGLLIVGNFRKGAVSANDVGIGLKLNTTVVFTPDSGFCASSGTNQAEDGTFTCIISPRSTSYLAGAYGFYHSKVSASGAAAKAMTFTTGLAAAIPNATITSVVIRAINNVSNNNVAVKEVLVYSLRGSTS